MAIPYVGYTMEYFKKSGGEIVDVIEAINIGKVFEFYKKEEGIKSSFKNLFHREKLQKEAVKDLSFRIKEGEIVGLLGPNGAGKTTTMKLLSGIIFPTEGDAKVLGFTPWKREKNFKRQISIIMAQKNQLLWDLPASESIRLNGYIYEVKKQEYQRNLEELVEMFGVKELMSVQVRRLSLGERMKFEIISSLIHKPKVVFLDEPTIGLDLIAQKDMWEFIRNYNEENKATIVLTSHYMQDIEKLCKRAIIINKGMKVYDGDLSAIKNEERKLISFFMKKEKFDADGLEMYSTLRSEDRGRLTVEVSKENIKEYLQMLINKYDITDFLVEEIPIEEKILNIYQKG